MQKEDLLIGIIGAGTMGTCIAADLLFHSCRVVLIDISEQALVKAKGEMEKMLRFAPALNKNLPKRNLEEAMSEIRFTTDLSEIATCDYVIENVTENWKQKAALYKQLNEFCHEDTYFAVNTSCISITKVAALMNNPAHIIGVHFMNPSYLKQTVEVIKGFHTSEACIEATVDVLKRLNKEAIIVNDYPGFVTNRISHLFMNEAAFVVQDGVATASQVDDIFKKCYGHKMGPLETADLIGLDTVMHSLDVLYESYQDPKFRCCPLLRKMVDANLLGRKTGKGFYAY